MKVTDLKVNELIHCITVAQCEVVQNLLHEAWLKRAHWTSYKEVYQTIYIPKQYYCPFEWTYWDERWYSLQNYHIFNAAEFIDQVKIIVDSTTYKVKDWKFERTFIINNDKKITALGNKGKARYMEFCNSKPEALLSFAKAAKAIAEDVDKERTWKQI